MPFAACLIYVSFKTVLKKNSSPPCLFHILTFVSIASAQMWCTSASVCESLGFRNSADSVSGGDNLEKTGALRMAPNHRFAAVIRPRNMASTAEERGTVPQISGKMPVLRSGDGEGPAFSPTKRLEQLVTWSSALLFDIRRNTVCKSRCVHFHKFQKWHPFSLYQHRPQPNDETIMSKSPK